MGGGLLAGGLVCWLEGGVAGGLAGGLVCWLRGELAGWCACHALLCSLERTRVCTLVLDRWSLIQQQLSHCLDASPSPPSTAVLCNAAPCCRQREAEAAEERSVQEYLRRRREREAQDAARQANKREAQDRWGACRQCWASAQPGWLHWDGMGWGGEGGTKASFG